MVGLSIGEAGTHHLVDFVPATTEARGRSKFRTKEHLATSLCTWQQCASVVLC